MTLKELIDELCEAEAGFGEDADVYLLVKGSGICVAVDDVLFEFNGVKAPHISGDVK